MQLLLEQYETAGYFDEYADTNGKARPHYASLARTLAGTDWADFRHRVELVNAVLLQRGVTFTVYADARGTERILPFDLIPRVIPPDEWELISTGVAQRVRALNAFLRDVYHEQRILRDHRIPYDLVCSSRFYCRDMIELDVPRDIYITVSGIDLIRSSDGTYYVLEDNLRTPSGISYVLENRNALKRSFPQLFESNQPRPVDDYPQRLRRALRLGAPQQVENPTIVVLTPGIYNSAYFEHAMLARRMGAELVEGQDLIVRDNFVYMKTTKGLARVDVIYRRIDDEFMDPLYFRPDSTLGAAGIMNAYRAGNVNLANAIGTGVADDKAIYPYVPEMIRFYLSEEPILANVPTYLCNDDVQRRHVLSHLDELVVKNTNQSGGYGMLMGPMSTSIERARFAEAIAASPRDFIAQPVIPLSCHPTIVGDEIVPRHIDLRPFVLYAEDVEVPPAALTRVALQEGSLVVNSSQGGGSKDTWVMEA
jgi:uncharacterized circularly permuted ATP-grasp superfamily protein